MAKTVLVVGATGQQGRPVIDALLNCNQASSFSILGLTRNPGSAAAQKLEARRVKLVQGDLNDIPALFEKAKEVAAGPIWGVFAMLVSCSIQFEGN